MANTQTPKTFHGGRAQVVVDGKIVGLFSSVSWGGAYDVQPVFLLGRMSAAESVYTGSDVVQVTCSGFTVVDHGPFVDGAMPALQDLLTAGYIELGILDRETNKRIGRIHDCRAANFSRGANARSLSEMTITYIGLRVSDESVLNAEAPGASDLP